MSTENEVISLQVHKSALVPLIEKVLGGEQEIKKTYESNFCMDKSWLIQTYHMIDQRIKSQNNGDQVAFRFKIKLEDGTERTLNDESQFLSFQETYNSDILGVSLNLRYLVGFAGDDIKKIQTINIKISKEIEHKNTSKSRSLGLIVNSISSINKIEILVETTQRTFGDDIINMFDNETSKILRKTTTFESVRFLLSLLSIILIMSTTVLYKEKIGSIIFNGTLTNIENSFHSKTTPTVQAIYEKINTLFEYIVERGSISIMEPFFGFIYVSLSLLLCFFILILSIPQNKSFIIYNETSKNMSDLYNKKKGRVTKFIILLVITPILINLSSTYIINLISKIF